VGRDPSWMLTSMGPPPGRLTGMPLHPKDVGAPAAAGDDGFSAMKILYVASECVPFCKTGGLADVVGALPKEFRHKRHDVRIILPKYKTIRAQEFSIKETSERVEVPMGGGRLESADIRAAKTVKGIPVYFINHDGYFGR